LLIGAGAILAAIPRPVSRRAEEAAVLVVAFVAAGAVTTIRVALVELAHRTIDQASSVRAFTLLDVVASTSLQVGLFVGGVLIGSATPAVNWVVDPYRVFVVVCGVAAFGAVGRLPREHIAPSPGA
jgi:hypothetical protein